MAHKQPPPAEFYWEFYAENPLEVKLKRKYKVFSTDWWNYVFQKDPLVSLTFSNEKDNEVNFKKVSPEERELGKGLLSLKKENDSKLFQYIIINGNEIVMKLMFPNIPWSETAIKVENLFDQLFAGKAIFFKSPTIKLSNPAAQ